MSKVKSSDEYTAFDNLVADLLTVPKTALKEKMAEHRETVDNNRNRRGPRRKNEKPHPPLSPRKGRKGQRRVTRPSAVSRDVS